MALPTNITHADAAALPTDLRERNGRPRRSPTTPIVPQPIPSTNERSGSHMPLDTNIHWTWDNPLNLLPVSMVLLLVLALAALLLGNA
ncbi:MAG TPA: hypothetical protein VFS21_16150 [Roseiflexaceae bacterium]|nr:hypothetical protein [Roseiflexaceae bacterium]